MSDCPPKTEPRQPRVAFLSLDNAADPNSSSGSFFWMRKGFKDIGCQVVEIFPRKPVIRPIWLAKKLYYRLRSRYYHWNREPAFLRVFGRIAEKQILLADPDFIIAVHSSACADLKVSVPIVLTHDQTFLERLAYVPFEQRALADEFVRQALKQERRSLHVADIVTYPSQRSCKVAETAFGVPYAKLRMIPWGANLPQVPSKAEVDQMIRARPSDLVVLTAIGVHWERKGGDLIIAAYRSLQRRGVNVRLNIIGMTPPTLVDEDVRVLPFVDKSSPDGFRKFSEILTLTHVLVAPSRVEAFGHIFAEAASFGVPAVAADVGGISTSIHDGVNGRLLPPDSTGDDYAEAIDRLCTTNATYIETAFASRARYEHDLNWPAFCRTIVKEVADLTTTPSSGVSTLSKRACTVSGERT